MVCTAFDQAFDLAQGQEWIHANTRCKRSLHVVGVFSRAGDMCRKHVEHSAPTAERKAQDGLFLTKLCKDLHGHGGRLLAGGRIMRKAMLFIRRLMHGN